MTDRTTESKASPETMAGKQKLLDLFRQRSMSDDELLTHAGLYLRSSHVAKILFINEIYELIRDIPGIIMEFGVHFGQNMSLFENLRAINEPFNQNRRIIGFDTFTGYASATKRERENTIIGGEGYMLPDGYPDYLRQVLAYHESNNILSHIQKHEVIVGDVVETVPAYFEKYRGDIVALAYFDLAIEKPTKVCLEAVLPHCVPGSVLLMDELNFREYDGASIAFKDVMEGRKYTVKKSNYMQDRSIVTLL